MDFRLSNEEASLKEKAAAFAKEHVAPFAGVWDREEQFPEEACRICAKEGLTGLTVPSSLGGPGASTVGYSLTIMELAYACSSTAVTVAVTSMVADTIARLGTEQQKAHYVPAILSGEFSSASFALSEPEAGSDAGSLRTRATYEGDIVHLEGTKSWISSGTHAGVFVVWARTGEGEGTRGISTFLVEPGDPGFRVGRKEDKMGLRASTTVGLEFTGCTFSKDRLLGQPAKGFRVAMQALDGGRIGVASQALGIARKALDCVDQYRESSGKEWTGAQQAIIAELKTEFAAARWMTLQAASWKDQGLDFSKKAAMAKAYSTEIANTICQEAVVLLGHAGCSDETPVERLLRDCKVTTIYEGTSEVQRIVISRSLLRE